MLTANVTNQPGPKPVIGYLPLPPRALNDEIFPFGYPSDLIRNYSAATLERLPQGQQSRSILANSDMYVSKSES